MQRDVDGDARRGCSEAAKGSNGVSMGIATGVGRGMQWGDSVELWWEFSGVKAGDATGLQWKCKRYIRYYRDARGTVWGYRRGHRVATEGCDVTLVGA